MFALREVVVDDVADEVGDHRSAGALSVWLGGSRHERDKGAPGRISQAQTGRRASRARGLTAILPKTAETGAVHLVMPGKTASLNRQYCRQGYLKGIWDSGF